MVSPCGQRSRSSRIGVLTAVLLASVPTPPAAVAAAAGRAFTVRDSIEMTILSQPNSAWGSTETQTIPYSPDGRRFFVVTRTGDLSTGLNDSALLVYDIPEILAGFDSPKLPEPREVATMSSASNRPAISSGRWLNSRTIAFIGEPAGEVAQIYTADVETGQLTKLTSYPTRIIDFDLSGQSGRFLFTAEAPLDWSQRIAHGYVVGTQNIIDVVSQGATQSLWLRFAFHIGHVGTTQVIDVDLPPDHTVRTWPWRMWVSPSGRWAISMRQVPNPPASWWKDYAPMAEHAYFKGVNDPVARDIAIFPLNTCLQYVLIDMETGQARPLLEAPAAFPYSSLTFRAHWIADESAVVLAGTFLPLTGADESELARRRAAGAVAEVGIHEPWIRRIDSFQAIGAEQESNGRLIRTTLDGDGRLVVERRTQDGMRASVYERGPAGWTRLQHPEDTNERTFHVEIAQGLNEPPELKASDPRGREKILTDLNPRFRSIRMGQVEPMRWTDAAGHEWIAGLLMPPDSEPGRRYPLVIQTHGFDPDAFLVDGPYGSPSGFAARALAGRDIAVLQMKDGLGPVATRAESEYQLAGYRRAIEVLAGRGLIDPQRVGIHGWSRTGFYVQQALISSEFELASASVSDASALGVWPYVFFFGASYPSMLEFERMIDARPWGDSNAATWLQRDPTFHLDRVRTPLRIECYAPGFGWWDTYAILRRLHQPVEYISIPHGSHTLVKPWERLTSQGGTVDWHDFWLNGHEDEDPAKAEQYARWREMRARRDAQRATETPARTYPRP